MDSDVLSLRRHYSRVLSLFLIPCLLVDVPAVASLQGAFHAGVQPSEVLQNSIYRSAALSSVEVFANHPLAKNQTGLQERSLAGQLENVPASFYGTHARGVLLLRELRKQWGEFRFQDHHTVKASDYQNKAFWNDEVIPGGQELRSVLVLNDMAGINSPIAEWEFVKGNNLLIDEKSVQKLHSSQSEDLRELIEIAPLHGQPGKYRALVHYDTVIHDPVYKESPYLYWTLVVNHEIAEYGRKIEHQDLVKRKLAANADPKLSILELYKRFSTVVPSFRNIVDHHALRSILFFNYYGYRYIREQQAKGRSVTLTDLTSEDIQNIASYAWRHQLRPGVDFWPARPEEMKRFEFNPATLTYEQKNAAVLARLQGHLVEELYVGGAGTRMEDYLQQLLQEGILTVQEASVFWFIPLGKLSAHIIPEDYPELKDDTIHWGARLMLRWNQRIRRLARSHPQFGISEEDALANQHFIEHLNEETGDAMMQDFIDHRFFGFDPAQIYFSKDGGHRYLRYFPELGAFKEDPQAPRKVAGHGTATERDARENDAFRVPFQGALEDVRAMDASIIDWLMLQTGRNGRRIQHQVRINNLMGLDPDVDVDLDALAINSIKEKHFFISELVENPSLIMKKGDKPLVQKGGILMILKLAEEGVLPVFIESLALKDIVTFDLIRKNEALAKELGERPLINLMGSYASSGEYGETLKKHLPAYHELVEDAETGLSWLKTQYVSGDVTHDPSLNHRVFFRAGKVLEDLKMPAYSQLQVANNKLRAMNQDPEFLALALIYGFDVTLAGLTATVENELKRFVGISQDPAIGSAVARALDILRPNTKNNPSFLKSAA